MSILIKGMEMPKCCGMCNAFFEKGNGFSCAITDTEVERLWYKRNKDCPLVEIPSKHGRLIDADEFEDYIVNGFIKTLPLFRTGKYKAFAHNLTECFCSDIEEAPTIIEAEE